MVPAKFWECKECQIISREKLIRQLKEKSRQKAAEREQKRIQEKLAKQEARERREEEQKHRREEKETRKAHAKQQRLEQQAAKQKQIAEQLDRAGEGGLVINGSGQKPAEPAKGRPTALQQLQAIIGPDGRTIARQTTLKVAAGKKPRRQEHALTPAEREKLERNKLIKEQFQLFSMTYPELVERNTIRYPIPDALILKLPELHGGLMPEKPKPLRVLIEADEFEQLLYIWEFCNNFGEFLDTPGFRIEELRAALRYTPDEDARTKLSVADQQELLPWNE